LYYLLQETKIEYGIDSDIVLPEWMRTMEEIVAVVDGMKGDWVIEEKKTLSIECPIYRRMKRGDISFDRFVEINVNTARSFVNRTLVDSVGNKNAARFWEIFEKKARQDRTGSNLLPDQYYHYVLLRRC